MADLMAVDARLRAILAPYRDRLSVREDASGLVLEQPGHEGRPWGFVAGTRVGKRYVSFYLMPVYGRPELLDVVSPALRRRMHGKSCFNLAAVDEPLLAELDALTARAIPVHAELVADALAAASRRRQASRSARGRAGGSAVDGRH
jgi:hypothetical protein